MDSYKLKLIQAYYNVKLFQNKKNIYIVKPLISWPNIKVYLLGSRQKQEMDFTKTKTYDLQNSKAIRAAANGGVFSQKTTRQSSTSTVTLQVLRHFFE